MEASSHEIQLGVGVAGIRIGMTEAELRQAVGEPSQLRDVSNEWEHAAIEFGVDGGEVLATLVADDSTNSVPRVLHIAIWSKQYCVNGHPLVDQPKAKIDAVLGEPSSVDDYSDGRIAIVFARYGEPTTGQLEVCFEGNAARTVNLLARYGVD